MHCSITLYGRNVDFRYTIDEHEISILDLNSIRARSTYCNICNGEVTIYVLVKLTKMQKFNLLFARASEKRMQKFFCTFLISWNHFINNNNIHYICVRCMHVYHSNRVRGYNYRQNNAHKLQPVGWDCKQMKTNTRIHTDTDTFKCMYKNKH